MDKFWLKSYPPGVPAEIDYTRYRSLVHLLEEAFDKYAQRNAYVCMDRFITYADVDLMSKKLGAWLQAQGLSKGARVALMMPNVLQYPVAIAAVLRAGYVVVNVNPLYTARELEHQLKDSGAEAIIILENFASVLEKVIARTQIKVSVVASMGDLLGGIKGGIVNFVIRTVKKWCPNFLCRTPYVLIARSVKAHRSYCAPLSLAMTASPSFNTPVAPPVFQRARRSAIAMSLPIFCKTKLGCSRQWTNRHALKR